jgi:formylglycine-generating enzyme required for sulfatase activity
MEAGLKVWFDKDDLQAGRDWQTQLEEAIEKRATAFAVYVGSRGLINWVEQEVRLALSRAATSNGQFPFIPILAAQVETSTALPGFVRQFQGVWDVENRPDEFQKLLAAVLERAGAGNLQLESEPFFGLKAIDETRNHLFFGREQDTQALVERLRTRPLLMVMGDSGSGKSSLVRAGLIPRWRGGALAEHEGRRPNEEIWHVIDMRPTANPLRALGDAVFSASVRLGRNAADCGTYKEWGMGADVEKRRDGLRCGLPANATHTLLIVDQFEELVTLTPPEQRNSFVTLLLDLIDPPDGHFAVVLTMRRDYYNLCSEIPELYKVLEANDRAARYLLERMKTEDLRRVVTEPLKLAGVEEGDRAALAQSVLQDVGDRAGDLALVQFALTEAWRRRREYGNDLLRAYTAVGRVEGALAGAAERVYVEELGGDGNESVIQAVFIRLVRLADTGGATRRVARRAEFDERRWALLQTLASEKGNRLVLISGGEKEETAEIAHEALVTQWPRFQRWLQHKATEKRTLDALIERAAGWSTVAIEQEKSDWLAAGVEREAFAQLLAKQPEWLSATERTFVEASVEAEDKRVQRELQAQNAAERTRRRQWYFSLALLILFLGAIMATWFWKVRVMVQYARSIVLARMHLIQVPDPKDNMIKIAGGTYEQGSRSDNSEQPVRAVAIKPFAMGKYEVTFEEYDRYVELTGGQSPFDQWGREKRPVIYVSWEEAKAYAQWLSCATGKHYRLPTESEWEYAARRGGKDETWAGTSNIDQLKGYAVFNTRGTQPVGSKQPNGLGLHDMSGNVREWVEDCWHGNYKGAPTDGSAMLEEVPGFKFCRYRVYRGGSWGDHPDRLRASFRGMYSSHNRDYSVGFRLAQDLP